MPATPAREYHTRTEEKQQWGEGPWLTEPDKVQWTDDATGYPCLIVRNRMGALCGYVGLSPGHPNYGAGYDDVAVDVHGGLTYAAGCRGDVESESICHIPEPGQPDNVWWLGFDCAHYMDLSPQMAAMWKPGGAYHTAGLAARLPRISTSETYRDVAYVRAECASLALQLFRIEAYAHAAKLDHQTDDFKC